MPRTNGTRYRVLKDFDFSPSSNVVLAFKKGEERDGLTAACVERGFAVEALEEIKDKDAANGAASKNV